MVTVDFITFNWSFRLFMDEWMNACAHLCFLEQVIHHRKSEEFSHFLFLKYPRNVQYRPVSMATEVIGVWMCVVRMDGNTAYERLGESVILLSGVKHRDRTQLKLFYKEMIRVYRCGFTRRGDMSQQIHPLSLCVICSLRVVLRHLMECKQRRWKRRKELFVLFTWGMSFWMRIVFSWGALMIFLFHRHILRFLSWLKLTFFFFSLLGCSLINVIPFG